MQSRSASQSSTASPEATTGGVAGRAARGSGWPALNTPSRGNDARRSNCAALISLFPAATVVSAVRSAERQKYVARYLNPRLGPPQERRRITVASCSSRPQPRAFPSTAAELRVRQECPLRSSFTRCPVKSGCSWQAQQDVDLIREEGSS